jgi:hypothetical protein
VFLLTSDVYSKPEKGSGMCKQLTEQTGAGVARCRCFGGRLAEGTTQTSEVLCTFCNVASFEQQARVLANGITPVAIKKHSPPPNNTNAQIQTLLPLAEAYTLPRSHIGVSQTGWYWPGESRSGTHDAFALTHVSEHQSTSQCAPPKPPRVTSSRTNMKANHQSRPQAICLIKRHHMTV